MTTATLTSLAILKVTIDQGKDYFDHLQAFILQALVDQKPDPVTDQVVKAYILEQFGLEIPERSVQVVLKRLSKKRLLKKEKRIYRIIDTLPDPQISIKQVEVQHHIQSVVSGLSNFAKSTSKPILHSDNCRARDMHFFK